MVAFAVYITIFAFASVAMASPHLLPTPGVGSRSLVTRQSVPDCVATCLGTATAATAECTSSDFNCLCKNQAFVDAAGTCYAASCDAADNEAGIAFGVQTCAAIGVSVSFSGASATAASAVSSVAPSSVASSISQPPASSSAPPTSASSSSAAVSNTASRPSSSSSAAAGAPSSSGGSSIYFSSSAIALGAVAITIGLFV